MACLELNLLGGFQARAIGTTLDIAGRKERALLAVLALSPREPLARTKLAAMLWSDRGEKQAHDSLKSAIARLKKTFDSIDIHPIVSSRESVALKWNDVTVDVATFDRLVGERSAESLAAATALYRGDLLDGFDIEDRAFEEWLVLERQRLRVLARDALAELLGQYVASRNRDSAVVTAHRLLRLDPVHELAHRALMRLYADQGQRTLAIQQFRNCCDALRNELGVAPEAETVMLYRSIREERTATGHLVGQGSPRAADLAGYDDPPFVPDAAALVKPVIAVLPFENLSGEAEQRYFSDGITDDIITALSRFRSIFVIARNSSFQYRDKPTDVRRIARELGVQYVVEGSVRRGGNQLRIKAQLVDATTGNHVWAERYDRSLDDVFTIQDEVVQTIVASLEGRLVTRIAEQARRKPTQSMLAYECVLQARQHVATFDVEKAEPLARRAIELDPRYAQASACLAFIHLIKYFFDPIPDLLDEALIHGKAGVALDEQDATCHAALGEIYLFRREFDLAGLHYERALALNPNDTTVIAVRADWLTRVGRVSEALAELDEALRRDPFPPNWYWETRSVALLRAGRFAETIECIKRMTQKFSWSHADLAACYAHLGRMDEARVEAAEVLRMQPNFTISWLLREEPDKNPADAEPLVQGMRLAGLPE